LEEQKQELALKCEDYSTLIRQIDPNFQENTFGGNLSEIQSKYASNIEQLRLDLESNVKDRSAEKRNYQSVQQDQLNQL